MKYILKSKNREEPAVKLSRLLALMPNLDDIKWRLFNLLAVGKLDKVKIIDLEKLVSNSENGYEIDFSFLEELAVGLDDIQEILITGSSLYSRNLNITGKDAYENFDYWLELVDSSYWEVFSKNESFIKLVKSEFLAELD